MVNILANAQTDGAVVVRIYKQGIPDDTIIGKRTDNIESLEKYLVIALNGIGSRRKPKYQRKLLKVLCRGK